MAAVAVCLLLFLAMASHSDATYCVCNTGVSDSVLQKNIDYACGAGADCTSIQQNGPCYNPNTVRDHCNYAVNSYYQRRGQITGSCDFQGTATVTATAPNAASGCVFQSSPSTGGTVPALTPPTGTVGTSTPAGGTGTSTGTGTGTGTGTSTGTGTGTGTGTFPTVNPLGPSQFNSDGNSGTRLSSQSSTFMLLVPLCFLFSGLIWLRM